MCLRARSGMFVALQSADQALSHVQKKNSCTIRIVALRVRPAGVPCQIIPQIIPHPLAQSASAPGSRKIFYDSLSSTLRLAALIEWETEIRQAGEAVFNLENLENDENNALRFSHGLAVDFETLK